MNPDLWHSLTALAQVILIDITLAGDNAVVVGLAVAGLPARQRRVAVGAGVGAACVLRVALGAVTLQLLQIVGLLLAGGILLLWVCWKMFRELRRSTHASEVAAPKSLGQAVIQILLADLSMSLDNVLAVAGAAQGHLWVLVTGIVVSVVLMGIAANMIASLLERHRWVAWIGLLVVLYVALRLVWDGSRDVVGHFGLS